jgi:uncharacterized protein
MNTHTSPTPDAASGIDNRPGAGAPWWKFPIVWLVVGGPLIVVIASLNMVVLAVRNVDPVLESYHSASSKPGHAPAVQGRNRAADTAMRPADH